MTFGRLTLTLPQIALAVATALVVAANVYFGVTYLDARQQQRALDHQYRGLEDALQTLVSSTGSPDGVGQVGALAFPPSPPSVELTDLVIRSARDSGVEVVSLRSVAAPNEAIGGGEYRAVRVDVRLLGDGARLSDFFGRLEEGDLATLVVDNLTISSESGRAELTAQIVAYATNPSEAR